MKETVDNLQYPQVLKWTKQRKMVYRVLWEAAEPLSAVQIYHLTEQAEGQEYAVCLECHRRIPLQNCPFAHIHLEKDAGDFTVTGHKLELYGYCSECKKNPNDK